MKLDTYYLSNPATVLDLESLFNNMKCSTKKRQLETASMRERKPMVHDHWLSQASSHQPGVQHAHDRSTYHVSSVRKFSYYVLKKELSFPYCCTPTTPNIK